MQSLHHTLDNLCFVSAHSIIGGVVIHISDIKFAGQHSQIFTNQSATQVEQVTAEHNKLQS